MYPSFSEPPSSPSPPPSPAEPAILAIKPPRTLLQDPDAPQPHQIIAFPPNRDTLGGTAYLIWETANILVDCPAWNDATRQFLQERGGVHWLVLTGRDGIGKVREIQTTFDCQILIHEQEAYLLPGLPLTQFEQEFSLTDDSRMLWTPGHSPGSACLYHRSFGGVLFSGRHLLPSPQGKLMPLQTAKTFHWRRQLRSVQRLLEEFTLETLQYVCPGANTGFLRGKHLVENAYEQLSDLKLEVLT